MLYNEIYHTHRTVEKVISDRNIFPQKNMFSEQMYKIQNIALEMVNTDYQLFFTDNLTKVHENFKVNDYYKIFDSSYISAMLNLSIMEFEIAKNKYQILLIKSKKYNVQGECSDTTYVAKYKIYYVLKIFNKQLLSYLNIVEPYMKAIQLDDPRNYNWAFLKYRIIKPCNTDSDKSNLDKFLDKNLRNS